MSMNILDGKLKYVDSKTITETNIRLDRFTGLLENTKSFDEREDKDLSNFKLGDSFMSSIKNVKCISEEMIKVLVALAKANTSVHALNAEITVGFDNDIDLATDFVISILLPDLKGSIIMNCKHQYVAIREKDTRKNDIYNIKIDFINKVSSDDVDNLVSDLTINRTFTLVGVTDNESVETTGTYEATLIDFYTKLEKNVPEQFPGNEYLKENLQE